ncbi:hypothetical protein AA313_de0202596 [Arthrobotrys entomopaga]|nr:hypothetical protein AA313_de0202596 [Arthrobotrys entomopaga]
MDFQGSNSLWSLYSDADVKDSTLQQYNQGHDRETKRTETSFPAFVAHISALEKQMRDSGTIFLNEHLNSLTNRTYIGEGASFVVEKAIWVPKLENKRSPPPLLCQKTVVAIKTAVPPSEDNPRRGWSQILLEVRALLHENLRYHPNIAHLIGLCWGSLGEQNNPYPQLIMEFAEYGTLADLQSSRQLSFPIKQKLLYDAGKGLSIIHACQIIHGDIKRPNILIFSNKSLNAICPYTAKLGDFGGAVIESSHDELRTFLSPTANYRAPEAHENTPASQMKQCDVYSFGLMICETFLDGSLQQIHPSFHSQRDAKTLKHFKESGDLLPKALEVVQRYINETQLPLGCGDIITYAVRKALSSNPADRDLTRVQLALRGTPTSEIENFISSVVEVKNHEWEEANKRDSPGKHGATLDSIGLVLGRMGGRYDPQNNLPGWRPSVADHLAQPNFLFDPERLKLILSWSQQRQIFDELRRLAEEDVESDVDISKSDASFFLFQSLLSEFGTYFDPAAACEALWKAGKEAAHGDKNAKGKNQELASRWVWRVSQALGHVNPDLLAALPTVLTWAIIRGDWLARQEAEEILSHVENNRIRTEFRKRIDSAVFLSSHFGGDYGSTPFIESNLLRGKNFTIFKPETLRREIEDKLGDAYASTVRPESSPAPSAIRNSQSIETSPSPFDRIFVNNKGHGILHMTAAAGYTHTIDYLVNNFVLNIDLPSQASGETPLICACYNGHFEASLHLLSNGANPNGHRFSQEAPLHWLSKFKKNEMSQIAEALLEKGARIEEPSKPIKGNVRQAYADWEEIQSVPVTPLGRSVLLQDMDAIKLLLKLGADPMIEVQGLSSIHIAAALALPDILQTLLDSLEANPRASQPSLDVAELLDLAHSGRLLQTDTFSLLTRLTHHGVRYHSSAKKTIQVIQQQHIRLTGETDEKLVRALCSEIRLGNLDLIHALLQLDHSPRGSHLYMPLLEAIRLNHEAIFNLIKSHVDLRERPPEYTFTPLQILATRSSSSRDGIGIAKVLVESGIPVSESPPGFRPPVIEAIRNGYYDLANFFIDNGALVSCVYQTNPEGPRITILYELINLQTEMSLKILEDLLCVGKPSNVLTISQSERENFSFIADWTNKLTVLHILAFSSPTSTKNPTLSQLYMEKLEIIVDTFQTQECLEFSHPIFGTALCTAVLYRNRNLVKALIKTNLTLPADPNSFPPELFKVRGLYPKFRDGTPLQLALGYYTALIEAMEQSETMGSKQELDELELIINILQNKSFNKMAQTEFDELKVRKKAIEIVQQTRKGLSQLDLKSDQSPVDLSVSELLAPPGGDEKTVTKFKELSAVLRALSSYSWYGIHSKEDLQREQIAADSRKNTN